jgi:hypothetical protein
MDDRFNGLLDGDAVSMVTIERVTPDDDVFWARKRETAALIVADFVVVNYRGIFVKLWSCDEIEIVFTAELSKVDVPSKIRRMPESSSKKIINQWPLVGSDLRMRDAALLWPLNYAGSKRIECAVLGGNACELYIDLEQ